MTRKELKQKIKEEQKELAQKIKKCRPLRKPHLFQKASIEVQQECLSWKVQEWSRDFRHRHIIYCNMFNNTPFDKIEKPRDNNRPSSRLLDQIKNKWEAELDEEVIYNYA